MEIFPLFKNLDGLQLPSAMLETEVDKISAWDLIDEFEDHGMHLDFAGTKTANCRFSLRRNYLTRSIYENPLMNFFFPFNMEEMIHFGPI